MASPEAGPARRRPTLLCAGIAVIDEVFRVDSFPVPEMKVRATAFFSAVGGCAANAAVAIARLGGQARLAAPLGGPAGKDAIGDRILAGLARESVDTRAVMRLNGVTSPLSAICIDTAGERTIVNYRDDALAAVSADNADALVGGVDAVLADNRFPEFVLPICRAARRRGLPVILDGDKPTRMTDALLAAASHIVFSAEGLRETAGRQDLGAALLDVARHSHSFLAVTDGANDILWIDDGTVRRLPAFSVHAVDTLAAGDIFHGAFALALVEGRDEAQALRFAAAAAAIKCTRMGGGAGAPTRAEVDAFLGGRS